MSAAIETVTMVKAAIHNPADPRHFMRITLCNCPVSATINGVEIARSTQARKVKEVAYDIYDAAFYFPREDIRMDWLNKAQRSTHCPLKGDTEYFDAVIDGQTIKEIGWAYDRTIDIAAELKDLVSFDRSLVQIVEHTTESAG